MEEIGHVLLRKNVYLIQGDHCSPRGEFLPQDRQLELPCPLRRSERLDHIQNSLHYGQEGEALPAVDIDRENTFLSGLLIKEVTDTEGLAYARRAVSPRVDWADRCEFSREAGADFGELDLSERRKTNMLEESFRIGNK